MDQLLHILGIESFDPVAVLGAALPIFLMMAWGAYKAGKLNPYYLIDGIGGVLAGAVSVQGLADIAATDPWPHRLIAGALLALGAKFALTQYVTKPMQSKNIEQKVKDAVNDLQAMNVTDTKLKLAPTDSIAQLGVDIKKANSPQEIVNVIRDVGRLLK